MRAWARQIGIATVVVAICLPADAVDASVDAPQRVGGLTIVDATDPAVEISGGGSAVQFTFRLPVGTTCPGDSAHDDWRVNGFLIPAGDDPATLDYGPNGPQGPGQWAIYGTDSNPLMYDLLARNPAPGSPGLILPIRPLTFAVYTDDILEPGKYRMGIACVHFTQTALYWDTEVEVVEDAADEPARRRWSVVGSDLPEAAAEGSESRSKLPLLIGAGFAVIAAGLLLAARGRRTDATRPAEHVALASDPDHYPAYLPDPRSSDVKEPT